MLHRGHQMRSIYLGLLRIQLRYKLRVLGLPVVQDQEGHKKLREGQEHISQLL